MTEKQNTSQSAPVLDIRGLSKTFGGHRAVDDVSLVVQKGEVVVILGPSGAGKSSLLRAINWLEPPSTGTVSLHGLSVTAPAPDRQVERLRRDTAMVFQNFSLWPHLTALQNVALAPIRVQKRPKSEVIAEASALLERVGLADKRDAYPSQLSGGQKQRIGIARALAMKPQLLLLDEPTSALDPELVGEVLAVIKSLAGQHTTMLIVTHEIGFAREVADRILFMEHGRITEDAPSHLFFSSQQSDRVKQFLSRHQ